MNELTFTLFFYWDSVPSLGCLIACWLGACAMAFVCTYLWNKSWHKRHKTSLIGSTFAVAVLVTLPIMNCSTAQELLQKGGSVKLERKLISLNFNQLEKALQESHVPSDGNRKAKAQAVFTELCQRTLHQSIRHGNAVFPCKLNRYAVPDRLIDTLCTLHTHRRYGNELKNLYNNCSEKLRADVAHAIAEAQRQQHESSLNMWANMWASIYTRLYYSILALIALISWGTLAFKDIRMIHPIKA